MIDSQDDLSELDKLHYLKSAMTGEAATKLQILSIDGINYVKAWELLEKAYGVKRILISRHLSMILNAWPLDKENSKGLTQLTDNTQQHIASLKALGISVRQEIIVQILEGKLPQTTIEKWEESLTRDEFPTLDQMLDFLYKTAVSASIRERRKNQDADKNKNDSNTKVKGS
ncbi:uncharacterized protein [Prorops nasuta]|uniref:uncharacterized protein n=1 Tax=Prorops nasuta TaxID=863751 RepID=UPI0034CFD332